MNVQIIVTTAAPDWPPIRSVLTTTAWDFMRRYAGEVTPFVVGIADALAHGGEIRPGHVGLAIRTQRRIRRCGFPCQRGTA